MISLFTSFDLKIFYFSFFFIFSSSILFLNFFNINFTKSFFDKLNLLWSFFFSLKSLNFNKFSLLMFVTVSLSIFFLNFSSVFSFIFPLTSQFGPMFMFSLIFWCSLMLFNNFFNFKGFLSHLIPEGSPLGLCFIMFVIELVSSIIRPLTLTVRLVANILAGHLLMILLSNLVFIQFYMFPLYILLNLVELFVAMIQSYIFCTMMILYFSEVH